MSGAVAILPQRRAAGAATSVEAILIARRMLTPEAIERARLATQESGEGLVTVVTRLGLLSEEALVNALADETGLPVIDLAARTLAALFADRLSIPFLREHRCLPVGEEDGVVVFAIADPFDIFVAQSLGFVFAQPVHLVLSKPSDIERAIDRLYGVLPAAQAVDIGADDADIEQLRDLVSDAPVIRAVNNLIAEAIDERASDIHIEPTDDRLAIRFRIDGVMQVRDPLPAAMRAPLVSRIKVMAGLNIAERRLPQDGRMRIAVRGNEIDLRVATMPAINGEGAVLRILDKSQLSLDFATLGFDQALADKVRHAVSQPHGILLVTGPTGSGKTTTLYSALASLDRDEAKLLTIEDPIEYRMPGVIQTQVNPQIGLTFSTALRSFLRLDPDVMMVGEIRDTETAQIAVQAALTGHLILSTLHTNSAAGAIGRLIDMAVEPFLLGSVLNGILAQRLARRLCNHCAEPLEPDAELRLRVGLASTEGAFRRAKGCPACHGTGYAGRLALFEYLDIDADMARLVMRGADNMELAEAAQAKGMQSLRQDALDKAARGLTSIEEAVRVTAGE